MAEQQLRNVTGHVVVQAEFNPDAKLRNVTGHVVIQKEQAGEALLRNVTGHVVIQQQQAADALIRNVTGHVVIQQDNTGRLTGGDATYRAGNVDEPPHVEISQPMTLNIPERYVGEEVTVLVLYKTGTFGRQILVPERAPWELPVTGDVSQIAVFEGVVPKVTCEALRRGMLMRQQDAIIEVPLGLEDEGVLLLEDEGQLIMRVPFDG